MAQPKPIRLTKEILNGLHLCTTYCASRSPEDITIDYDTGTEKFGSKEAEEEWLHVVAADAWVKALLYAWSIYQTSKSGKNSK